MFGKKQKEQRIKELQELIYVQGELMSSISNKRGEYIAELLKLMVVLQQQ